MNLPLSFGAFMKLTMLGLAVKLLTRAKSPFQAAFASSNPCCLAPGQMRPQHVSSLTLWNLNEEYFLKSILLVNTAQRVICWIYFGSIRQSCKLIFVTYSTKLRQFLEHVFEFLGLPN